MRPFRIILTVITLLPLAVWASEPRLERELARIGDMSGGTMGIAAVHLESGRSAWLNPDQSFPMASTYKVPIAVQLLHLVDAGELNLDDRIEIGMEEYSPGSGANRV